MALILDLGIRPVVALFLLFMPAAGTVLVFNGAAFPRRTLLLSRSCGGGMRLLVGSEGLREDIANFVGPAAIVLDNRVGDLGSLVETFLWYGPSDNASADISVLIWRLRGYLAMTSWTTIGRPERF